MVSRYFCSAFEESDDMHIIEGDEGPQKHKSVALKAGLEQFRWPRELSAFRTGPYCSGTLHYMAVEVGNTTG